MARRRSASLAASMWLLLACAVACGEPPAQHDEVDPPPPVENIDDIQLTLRYKGTDYKSGERLQLPKVVAGEQNVRLEMQLELFDDRQLELQSQPPVLIYGADAKAFTVVAQPEAVLPAKAVVKFELEINSSELAAGSASAGIAVAWGKGSNQRFSVGLDLEIAPPEYVDVPFAVAVGEGGRIAVSWDRGNSWTETLETEDPIADGDGKSPDYKTCFDRCWRSVSVLNDRIVIAGFGKAQDANTLPPVRVWESFDGQQWQPVEATAIYVPGGGTSDPSGRAVFVGGVRSWFRAPQQALVDAGNFGYADGGSNMNGVAWLGEGFVAVGDGGRTFRSTDGVSWDLLHTGGGNLESVASNGERLVAVGAGRRRTVSLDGGLTWEHDLSEPRNDPPGCNQKDDFMRVAWNGSHFVTYESRCNEQGQQTAVRHQSENGIDWQQQASDAPHADIVATAGIAAGIGKYPYKALSHSADGLQFTSYTPEQGAMRLRAVAVGKLSFRKDEVADRLPGYAPAP